VVIERQAVTALQVDLNGAAMDGEVLPEEVTSAIADPVNEALTNVRKHTGVDRAVVRAVPVPDGVVMTVLDHGQGFGPGRGRARPWDPGVPGGPHARGGRQGPHRDRARGGNLGA
jgi:signal transduction histidine kinase